MKLLLAARGLPVGRYAVHRADSRGPDVSSLRYPLFVKPARGGSSVGITRVTGPEGLADALALAHEHDPKALIEEGLPGREIECAVLEGVGGAPAEASLPGEIRVTGSAHEFYDFDAKYLDDVIELDAPADLPEEVVATVRALAVQAFDALGCESLARVDFFVDGTTVIVNEVNTMPGFTPKSMFPMMWAATGLDYPALVDRLITSALARKPGLR
jgi:D-alanine-D-alanine ligase